MEPVPERIEDNSKELGLAAVATIMVMKNQFGNEIQCSRGDLYARANTVTIKDVIKFDPNPQEETKRSSFVTKLRAPKDKKEPTLIVKFLAKRH